MGLLEISHLTKIFPGGKKGVSNLSLSIEEGDIYGFIGHNGAGKTTAIKCVVGINKFEEGSVTIAGHSIVDDPQVCKKIIAYIPDNPDIYEYLTGIQYLNFIADIFGITEEDRTSRIRKYADAYEITASLGDLISTYSHGMKQKLVIISALIHKPKLMILDEPFVGLDPKAVYLLKQHLHEVCEQGGAVFFSTHVLDVAEKLCNKIAIIKSGELIAAGTMEELTHGASLESVFLKEVSHVI